MADGVVPTRPLCGDHEPHLPHQFVRDSLAMDCAGFAPNGCDDCSVEPGERHRYPACPGVRDQMPKAEAKPNSENAPNPAVPTPPYTEATVVLVAAALAAGRDDDVFVNPRRVGEHWDGSRDIYRSDARDALNALVKAGLLLPEGAETRTEWAWAHDGLAERCLHTVSSEEEARKTAGYFDGVQLMWRRIGPWTPLDAVRLAEGDSSKGSDFEGEADQSKDHR